MVVRLNVVLLLLCRPDCEHDQRLYFAFTCLCGVNGHDHMRIAVHRAHKAVCIVRGTSFARTVRHTVSQNVSDITAGSMSDKYTLV